MWVGGSYFDTQLSSSLVGEPPPIGQSPPEQCCPNASGRTKGHTPYRFCYIKKCIDQVLYIVLKTTYRVVKAVNIVRRKHLHVS